MEGGGAAAVLVGGRAADGRGAAAEAAVGKGEGSAQAACDCVTADAMLATPGEVGTLSPATPLHVTGVTSRLHSNAGLRRSPYFAPSTSANATAGRLGATEDGTTASSIGVTTALVAKSWNTPVAPPAAVQAPAPSRPWRPPHSPFGLLEELFWDRPWALLLCCILLNQTRRRQVDPILSSLLRRFPNPASLAAACPSNVEPLLRPLGLHRQRARAVVFFSAAYVAGGWGKVEELPGVGRYGADAHAIFCEGRYTQADPTDHALSWYRDWMVGLDAAGGGEQ